MKTPPFLLAACAAILLYLAPRAQAQTAPGAVSGRVQSEVTGQYLLNVRVTVKGTDLTAFTDSYGIFRLAGVPSGTVILDAFYSGLEPQQIVLTLAPGEAVVRDISLTSRATDGAKAEEAKADQVRQDLEKRQAKIAQMEADGLTGTPEHTQAVYAFKAAEVAGSQKITDHLDKAEAFRTPLQVVPIGKKTAKVEKHTVIKRGITMHFAVKLKINIHIGQ